MYEKQYKFKQIYYSNWSDQLEDQHVDYWWSIASIAEWIGNALESSRRRSSVPTSWLSTIGVSQTKEKFGEVRVYCHLALPSAVEEKYNQEVEKIKKQNIEYHNWVVTKKCPLYMEKRYKTGPYPLKIPDLYEFTQECYLNDLKYYRRIYIDAFRLWPQYEAAIRGGADLMEYLFENEDEVDEHYDYVLEKNLDWYRRSSGRPEIDEESIIYNSMLEREKVKEICCFLSEEWEELCQNKD